MKKVIKKLTTIIVAAAMLLPLVTYHASAESSVLINSVDKIKGGDTFTITITYDGSNIGRVDAGLNYDTDKLAYVSGGSNDGNSGYVHLNLAGTGEAITFNLKFQAIQEGETDVSVETYEMYDLDERYISETPSASKTISVKGNASNDQIIKQETSPDTPVEPTSLKGVDEMDDSKETAGANIATIFIIASVILVALIIVVAVVLARKKKQR